MRGLSSGFSALQRAENSSILPAASRSGACATFQCSSASRKFLNERRALHHCVVREMFQCSSASRKFLNGGKLHCLLHCCKRFQCSSASRKFLNGSTSTTETKRLMVSVLFSEPKIPQFVQSAVGREYQLSFSALQRAENSSILDRRRPR